MFFITILALISLITSPTLAFKSAYLLNATLQEDKKPGAFPKGPSALFQNSSADTVYKICNEPDSYFKVNAQRIEESNVTAWFTEWDRNINRTTDAYRDAANHWDYFMQYFLYLLEPARCDFGDAGCQMPDCDHIYTTIAHQGGDRDLARRVFFVTVSVKNARDFVVAIHKATGQLDSIMSHTNAQVAETFRWLPDLAAQKKCEMKAAWAKFGMVMGIALSAGAFEFALPVMEVGEVGAQVASAASAGVPLAVDVADTATKEKRHLDASGHDKAKTEGVNLDNDEGRQTDKDDGDDGHENDPKPEPHPGPEPHPNPEPHPHPEPEPHPHPEPRPHPEPEPPGPKPKPRPNKMKQRFQQKGKGLLTGVGTSLANNLITLGFGADLASAICKEPTPPDDLEENIAKFLDGYISKGIEKLQKSYEDSWGAVIHGQGSGENDTLDDSGTRLAQVIKNGEFFILSEEMTILLYEKEIEIKHMLERIIVWQAIIAALSSQGCHIHCSDKKFNNIDGKIADSRWYPEPGIGCQHQCWRDSVKTKNQELYGMDALKDNNNQFNYTLADIRNISFDTWQRERYNPTEDATMGTTMMDLLPQDPVQSTRYGGLGVCMSHIAPDDFTQKHNSDKVLPCYCGDEYGNETLQFLDSMNIQGWVNYSPDRNDSGIGVSEACQTTFNHDHTNPLQAFLAHCKLENHYPRNDDPGPRERPLMFAREPDPQCPDIELAFRTNRILDHDLHNATCYACFVSEAGVKLKIHQCEFWSDDDYTFANACHMYNDQHPCFVDGQKVVDHWGKSAKPAVKVKGSDDQSDMGDD
ncbi:uncharacterized protein KY384_007326 [Bacidia gigantensis]|uniref:uncharacterized protein n=1 Tax=Bacidia gigantensis TaxID=2732470 RepID=UPI001D0526BF|nr:uncharacterized protein KY384_007326 [Bacidia gigantensis]KAG8528408.1 hypothetical protein KY384_007326 [Bacidia gigantensis]